MAESLLDKRLILVVGKGGVGRSTVAASIASAAAARGRKTLLFQSSENDRYGSMFGGAAVGSRIVSLAPNLAAVNTNPAAALEEYGLMVLKFESVYKMVFENRVSKYFLRAIPGLDDYAVIGKAWFHTTEAERGAPRFDTVVFDMPASGHSLSMLRLPKVILETVPEGPLTRDARSLEQLLLDKKRTATIMVTLAEEMPTNEARELSQNLRREIGLEIRHLLINQVYPLHFPDQAPHTQIARALVGSKDPQLAALAEHAALSQSRRALNERYIGELRATIETPQTELPLLFAPEFGPRELAQLTTVIAGALSPS